MAVVDLTGSQSTRILPPLTEQNEFFWRSGADGKLRFLRCQACSSFVHPPAPVCPDCLSSDLQPEPVNGTGTVASFTVNHQVWHPDVPVPYVVVLVELDDQPGLRLISNLPGQAPDGIEIGARVGVAFEPAGNGCYVPVFQPLTS